MTPAEIVRHEEALDWLRRIQDPGFADWDAHAVWLEADSRNLNAFDTASLLIENATDGLAPARAITPNQAPINDNPVSVPSEIGKKNWRWGLGLAVAATMVGLVSAPSLMSDGTASYLVQTAPGEQRTLALADGTRIVLNGGSAVRLNRADLRVAAVERGEAFFSIVHDAAHPFAVHVGKAVFQDVGTAFDVIHATGGTDVAVREGAVLYDPAGAAVRLNGGQAIGIDATGATVRQIDASGIGGWRQGRLSYRDVSLSTIAADVSRSIGRPVTADRAIESRRFSGVIMIDPDRPRMFSRMAAVMGVSIRRDGTGWRMVSSGR